MQGTRLTNLHEWREPPPNGHTDECQGSETTDTLLCHLPLKRHHASCNALPQNVEWMLVSFARMHDLGCSWFACMHCSCGISSQALDFVILSESPPAAA
eukprot:3171574-Amphidinium_carterae.1